MRVVRISLVLLVVMLNGANAALFTEDWSSGSVNPSIWYETVDGFGGYGYGHDDISVVDPLGNGDNALKINGFSSGGDPLWGDQIVTYQTFGRSSGLTITYKVWNGNQLDTNIGMYGGFWNGNTGPPYALGEAVVGYISPLEAYEKGEDIANGNCPPMLGLYGAVWWALTKATAPIVEITLDPVQGATWAYSIDGGLTFTVERNTLGTGSSNSDPLCVGFAPHHGQGGTTMIDDIVVTPEPATVALLGIGAALALSRRKRM